MTDRLLLLSYAFPPMAVPEAFLSAKTMGNLDGYSVDVFCANPRDYDLPLDSSLDDYVQKRFGVIVRLSPTSSVHRLPGHLPDNFPIINQMPDSFAYANSHLVRRVSALDLSQYRVFVSWSQWNSAHLAGLEIKRKNPKLKWIAHFSDPWVDNPLLPKTWPLSWLNRRMEQRVIQQADAVVFTSPETVDLVMRKYPRSWRDKVFYVPHCYDGTLYDPSLMPPKDGYVLRCLGNFYGHRSPMPFFKAIEQIAQQERQLLTNVSVEFVGSLGGFRPADYPLARQIVRSVGKVSYTESLRLMQTAQCLLVIDASAEESIFFPSKLVDYLGANRFVLAISPKGTTARVVKEMGGIVVDPSDDAAIVGALRKVFEERPSSLSRRTGTYAGGTIGEEMRRIVARLSAEASG